MNPRNLLLGVLFCTILLPGLSAWCIEATDPAMIELEQMKKNAEAHQKWVSEGAVSKREVVGFYRYWPFDWNAFWLKEDGTGLLYGGMRGAGIWRILWTFDERSSTLVIRSVQLQRQYKVIRKDGKPWMIEGIEVWRQGVSLNAPIPGPRDRAQYVASEAPEGLQRIR